MLSKRYVHFVMMPMEQCSHNKTEQEDEAKIMVFNTGRAANDKSGSSFASLYFGLLLMVLKQCSMSAITRLGDTGDTAKQE